MSAYVHVTTSSRMLGGAFCFRRADLEMGVGMGVD